MIECDHNLECARKYLIFYLNAFNRTRLQINRLAFLRLVSEKYREFLGNPEKYVINGRK